MFDKRLHDFGYPAGVTAAAGENLAWGFNGAAWQQSGVQPSNTIPTPITPTPAPILTPVQVAGSISGYNICFVTIFLLIRI